MDPMAEIDVPKRGIQLLSLLLIIGAVALYVGWGATYGSWNFLDPKFVPIYSLTVVMALFGILGLLLTRVGSQAKQ